MTTSLIPDQRRQLATCPVCGVVVDGLLAGCCGDPACIAAETAADVAEDQRRGDDDA